MIHHGVKQGSAHWHHLRGVIPTASNFDRIVTPAKWEPTKGDTRRGYILELLANRIFGIDPESMVSTAAMQHGREWEPIARAAYEFERGVEIQECGFFTDDQEFYGASPDGLIGSDGLIEIKNPAGPALHLSNLLDDAALYATRKERWTADVLSGGAVTGFLRDHWIQVQGQLLVTERDWCDVVSNFARLPLVVVRVHRNETFLRILQDSLTAFCDELKTTTEYAKANGWYKPSEQIVVPDGLEALGVTGSDIDALVAQKFNGGVHAES